MMPLPLRFQPGWSTPVVVRHTSSFIAWFLKFPSERRSCNARHQGKCPGLDQCHDCAWSPQQG